MLPCGADLLEAIAARKRWQARAGGRLDLYRAANWVLRSALAGRPHFVLGFLPPEDHPGSLIDEISGR